MFKGSETQDSHFWTGRGRECFNSAVHCRRGSVCVWVALDPPGSVRVEARLGRGRFSLSRLVGLRIHFLLPAMESDALEGDVRNHTWLWQLPSHTLDSRHSLWRSGTHPPRPKRWLENEGQWKFECIATAGERPSRMDPPLGALELPTTERRPEGWAGVGKTLWAMRLARESTI